jgi:hypothetical protein
MKTAKAKKAPKKIHTDPWALYGALKAPGSVPKLPGATGTGATPVKKNPLDASPSPTLGKDAEAALLEAARANPPRQWDQAGGPSAPVLPMGEGSANPPSRVDRADRTFSPKELAQIAKDAHNAVAQGAPRAKVAQRLKENGLDPEGVLNG